MKAFISQPMNGKTDEEIKSERKKAILSLQQRYGEDIVILDSIFDQEVPNRFNPGLWFLGRALQVMASADVVYFCKGWEKARGCKIENICALEYGIEVVEDYK